MKKKIRFPLEMDDGVEVRTLEELKENFNLDKILTYYTNGKLLTWLRDRFCDDLADQIEALDKTDSEAGKKLCDIFGVDYDAVNPVDLEELEERNRRLGILKECTDDEAILASVDSVAFDQDDLYDLLGEDLKTIYLCGDKFEIPVRKEGITYVGVNKPKIVMNSAGKIDWDKTDIHFRNVQLEGMEQNVPSYSKDEQKAADAGEMSDSPDAFTETEKIKGTLFVDIVPEGYSKINVLYMQTEDGEEKRISDNNGKSVLDFCESDEYVFYALKEESMFGFSNNFFRMFRCIVMIKAVDR